MRRPATLSLAPRRNMFGLVGSIVVLLVCGIAVSQTSANESPSATTFESDAEQFIEDLMNAVQSQDASRFSSMIDWISILDKALIGLPNGESATAFRDGFIESIEGPGGFSSSVVTAVGNGGSLTLLRFINEEDSNRALFRLILPHGGFNYIEMHLEKDDDENVRVTDIYPYSAGELISVTLRRAYLPFVVGGNNDMPEELGPTESLYIKHATEYSRFAELVSSGEAEQAMSVYQNLPEALQNDKNGLLLRLRATQQLGDEQYASALAAIREQYPNDPSSDLLSIDAYVLANKYEEALACIDRLDRLVHGDPYLNLQRAGLLVLKEDWASAEEFARLSMQDATCELEAYWTLVTISLRREDHDETLRLLKLMDDKFEMSWGDLTEIPEYDSFVDSAEFESWLAYLRDRGGFPVAQSVPPRDRKIGDRLLRRQTNKSRQFLSRVEGWSERLDRSTEDIASRFASLR